MNMIAITDLEFSKFQKFIFDTAGISLSPAKKALVSGRLAKRLHQFQCNSYSQYFQLITSGEIPQETQNAIDLLTTNETYFFREKKHFDVLHEQALAAKGRVQTFRVWSAASSTGEEAYSIAMVLADRLGDSSWEVVASDINAQVLEKARHGHYLLERTEHIPPTYLKRFCLKGIGAQEGTLLIDKKLRDRVEFKQINLNVPLPQLGLFDVIFLRNVMIYFNVETKRQVVSRMLHLLRPGGHFFVGHSESLNDVSDALQPLAPSIYRKPNK